jgi:non-heme chloroperoxidase
MRPLVQYAELANGITLQYAEQGDPAGLPIIFLHGVTDSWRSFELMFAHLPGSFRAIALSHRGHGDSDRPGSGYRAKDFAADLVALMDALGLERAVIVGHSMSTQCAQRFAIDHPERVLALALIGAFATMRGNAQAQEFWASEVAQLSDPIAPTLARAFQESTLAQPIPAWFLDTAVAESLKVPARVWRAAFEGFLQDDVLPELGGIQASTLIIWGDQDGFCSRAMQDALVAAIPRATLAIYAGVGHATHWEEPQRVTADLVTFVNTAVANPTGRRMRA